MESKLPISKKQLEKLNYQWLATMSSRIKDNENDVLFGFLLGKGLDGSVAYSLAYRLEVFDMTLL